MRWDRCLAWALLLAAAPGTAAELSQRLRAASAGYLGTPYAADPLGEGAGVDPDPLFDRRRVDCVTFVEQALAEALAPRPADLLPTLLRLRYRDGAVGFDRRNHHFVADWVPNNAWIVRDVTEAVANGRALWMTKRIDRALLLRTRGADAAGAPLPAVEERSTAYIPRSQVPAALSRLPDISIAVFVQDRPGIFAAHTGFLLREGSRVTFRHASRQHRRVVDEALTRYLQRAPARIVGLKVLALRPAPAVWPAGSAAPATGLAGPHRQKVRPAPPGAASARRTNRARRSEARRRTAPSP